MEKNYSAEILLNTNQAAIQKEKSKLSIGYDSNTEKTFEFYLDDPDADLFYISLEEAKEDGKTVMNGVSLSVDELELLIKHAQKLINNMKKGATHVTY